MKKVLWVLVGASLAANVWLLFRPEIASGPIASAPSGAGPAAHAVKSAVPAARGPSAVAEPSAANPARLELVKLLAEMDSNDLASVRDRLRAAGADEAMVYAVLDGAIRLRFYRVTRNTETENIRNGWWRGDPASVNKPAWGKDAEGPLFALMGYNPSDIVDFSSRFDFLPREKAEMLAKIAVDYFSLYLRVAEERSPATSAANQLTAAERRNDVVKLLTPEELAEYDLRFSDFAAQNVRRFAKMQATEAEFRAISPLLERAQREVSAKASEASIPPAERLAVQRAVEQRAIDDLVATVGYDRAMDYLWTGTTAVIRDATTVNATPLSAVASSPRLLQLASETGMAAAAIHYDAALSPEAKRTALVALQQATQPKLDQLLPPEARAALEPRALAWFDGLDKGEYVSFGPRLAGSTTVLLSPVSIAMPVRGNQPVVPQLRRMK